MKHILIIDDDDTVCEALKWILKDYDCCYAAMKCPHQAFQTLCYAHNEYDLIFCDYTMPLMTGVELISLLKQKEISIEMIGMSGNEANALLFQSVGVSLFLTKPFELNCVVTMWNTVF